MGSRVAGAASSAARAGSKAGKKAFKKAGKFNMSGFMKKAGKKGGLDLKSADPTVLNHINVFLNKSKGERKFETQFDENGNMRTGIFIKSNEEGDKGKFYTKDELVSYMDGETGGLPKIYDDTKDSEEMKSLIVGKNIETGRTVVKEDYLTEKKQTREDGTVEVVKTIDESKVKNSLRPLATATIEALGKKPTQLLSFYNNVLGGDPKISEKDLQGDMGSMLKENISEIYLEKFMEDNSLVDFKKRSYTYSPEKNVGNDAEKSDYDDITSIVQSLKSGNYQDVAFPGTVDNIKKSESVAKKGQNIVSVEIEVGGNLVPKEFDLNNKTSLYSLAEEIFKGSSKEIRSKRSEFVNQMLGKSNASASDDKVDLFGNTIK